MARTFRLRLCRPVVQKGKKLWRVYFSRYRFDRLRFTSPIVSRVSRSFSFAHAVILVYRTVHSSSLCVDKRSGIKKKKKKRNEREEERMEERMLHLWEHLWEPSVRALYASAWKDKNAMLRNYARTIYRFLFSLFATLWLFGHRVNIRCLVSCCTWAQHRGLEHQFPLMRYIIEYRVTFFSGSSHVTARNTCTRVLESTSLVTRLNAFNWKLHKGISSDGYKYGRAVDGDRVTNAGGKYVTLLNKMKKENG